MVPQRCSLWWLKAERVSEERQSERARERGKKERAVQWTGPGARGARSV